MSAVHQLYPLISKKGHDYAYIHVKPFPLGLHYNGPFILEDEQMKIHANGCVYIPAAFMRKHGYLRKDGRYAVAILPMVRSLDGKLVRGAVIPHIPGIEEVLETANFWDIITWENGNITINHPERYPSSVWYGQEHLLREEKKNVC